MVIIELTEAKACHANMMKIAIGRVQTGEERERRRFAKTWVSFDGKMVVIVLN